MTALPLDRRFLSALIPHRSSSVILNVVVDLGLLLLVSGCRPHFLRLLPGLEPSFVPLLPLVPVSPSSPLPENFVLHLAKTPYIDYDSR